MLKITNVSKVFDGVRALDNASLTLEEGKISGLIGPNGAGKTTLFDVITGTIPPDSGKIEFMDEDITGMRPYETCRKGIARTYQLRNLFPNLTVFENVAAGTLKDSVKPKEAEQEVYEILEFLELAEKERHVVSNLPPLETKLVELGRSLATHPKLILLDELVGGLLVAETEKICEVVKTLRNRGYTILQVGHEMGPIMKTSDWIVVLDKGSKLAEGPPEAIRNNETVQAIYLEAGGE